MSKNTEYILEGLADSEGLNGVLASLIAVAERKAKSKCGDKVSANQWSRITRRLKELREWCAEFGPGSTCR